jgi:hypothetical protein
LIYFRELYYEGSRTFYVFLPTQEKGTDAFALMMDKRWIGAHVALLNPKATAEYKQVPVLQLFCSLIPIASIKSTVSAGPVGAGAASAGPQIEPVGEEIKQDTKDQIQRSCRYNNIKKFSFENLTLIPGCPATTCDGRHNIDKKECTTYSPIGDTRRWVLQGSIWVAEPEGVPEIVFRSSTLAELFLHPDMRMKASAKTKIDGYALSDTIEELLEKIFEKDVSWTFVGYYKPGSKGTYFSQRFQTIFTE